MHDILSRLRSLLQWRSGEPIIVLHASFPDFLSDHDRCKDSRWFIDEPAHHRRLAAACFMIMHDHLHFNICGIKTSYYKNTAIDGINQLVDQNITPYLMYSSQYWADHLDLGVTASSDISGFPAEIRSFLNERFLFWLEVLSLKDCLRIVSAILRVTAGWCKVWICCISGSITLLISDLDRNTARNWNPMFGMH